MSVGRHTLLCICFQNICFAKSISEKVFTSYMCILAQALVTIVIKFNHKFSSMQIC